jgi:hypothetical protein
MIKQASQLLSWLFALSGSLGYQPLALRSTVVDTHARQGKSNAGKEDRYCRVDSVEIELLGVFCAIAPFHFGDG